RSIRRNRSSRPSPRRPRIVSLRPPNKMSAPNAARIPNEKRPLRGSPPIHIAARSASPSRSATAGWNHFDLVVCMEHRLHWNVEEAAEGEGERKGRCIAPRLDRVDGLARDAHRLREVRLREPPLEPPLLDVVVHCMSS